jgi:CheY-specific phosphatase CheX
MMNNTWKMELSQAATLTFEELCFLCPDPEAEAPSDEVTVDAVVRVTFRGPFNGSLVVKLYGDLLPTLAANMLGEEAPSSKDQQLDALCEVTNVICGNILPKIAGADEIFNLNPPAIVASPGPPAAGQEPLLVNVYLGIEEGGVELFLFADQTIPASI